MWYAVTLHSHVCTCILNIHMHISLCSSTGHPIWVLCSDWLIMTSLYRRMSLSLFVLHHTCKISLKSFYQNQQRRCLHCIPSVLDTFTHTAKSRKYIPCIFSLLRLGKRCIINPRRMREGYGSHFVCLLPC